MLCAAGNAVDAQERGVCSEPTWHNDFERAADFQAAAEVSAAFDTEDWSRSASFGSDFHH